MSAKAFLGHSRGRLAYEERRRLRRRRFRIFFSILTIISIGAALWGLHQRAVRISRVDIYGADQSLATYALEAMQGTYFALVPRDSTFFFPEGQIRARILADHSEIAALSLFRSGFDGLSIKVEMRVPIARWCGLSPTIGVEAYCYFFDSSGYLYAPATSTSEALNPFTLYAPLKGATQEPLGATLDGASELPSTFDLARQIGALHTSVRDLVIHDGEVDLYLASGTRVSYVLGREQDAFTSLVSLGDSVNLSDGLVDYVDLRFDGKVYLKKKVDSVQ